MGSNRYADANGETRYEADSPWATRPRNSSGEGTAPCASPPVTPRPALRNRRRNLPISNAGSPGDATGNAFHSHGQSWLHKPPNPRLIHTAVPASQSPSLSSTRGSRSTMWRRCASESGPASPVHRELPSSSLAAAPTGRTPNPSCSRQTLALPPSSLASPAQTDISSRGNGSTTGKSDSSSVGGLKGARQWPHSRSDSASAVAFRPGAAAAPEAVGGARTAAEAAAYEKATKAVTAPQRETEAGSAVTVTCAHGNRILNDRPDKPTVSQQGTDAAGGNHPAGARRRRIMRASSETNLPSPPRRSLLLLRNSPGSFNDNLLVPSLSPITKLTRSEWSQLAAARQSYALRQASGYHHQQICSSGRHCSCCSGRGAPEEGALLLEPVKDEERGEDVHIGGGVCEGGEVCEGEGVCGNEWAGGGSISDADGAARWAGRRRWSAARRVLFRNNSESGGGLAGCPASVSSRASAAVAAAAEAAAAEAAAAEAAAGGVEAANCGAPAGLLSLHTRSSGSTARGSRQGDDKFDKESFVRGQAHSLESSVRASAPPLIDAPSACFLTAAEACSGEQEGLPGSSIVTVPGRGAIGMMQRRSMVKSTSEGGGHFGKGLTSELSELSNAMSPLVIDRQARGHRPPTAGRGPRHAHSRSGQQCVAMSLSPFPTSPSQAEEGAYNPGCSPCHNSCLSGCHIKPVLSIPADDAAAVAASLKATASVVPLKSPCSILFAPSLSISSTASVESPRPATIPSPCATGRADGRRGVSGECGKEGDGKEMHDRGLCEHHREGAEGEDRASGSEAIGAPIRRLLDQLREASEVQQWSAAVQLHALLAAGLSASGCQPGDSEPITGSYPAGSVVTAEAALCEGAVDCLVDAVSMYSGMLSDGLPPSFTEAAGLIHWSLLDAVSTCLLLLALSCGNRAADAIVQGGGVPCIALLLAHGTITCRANAVGLVILLATAGQGRSLGRLLHMLSSARVLPLLLAGLGEVGGPFRRDSALALLVLSRSAQCARDMVTAGLVGALMKAVKDEEGMKGTGRSMQVRMSEGGRARLTSSLEGEKSESGAESVWKVMVGTWKAEKVACVRKAMQLGNGMALHHCVDLTNIPFALVAAAVLSSLTLVPEGCKEIIGKANGVPALVDVLDEPISLDVKEQIASILLALLQGGHVCASDLVNEGLLPSLVGVAHQLMSERSQSQELLQAVRRRVSNKSVCLM